MERQAFLIFHFLWTCWIMQQAESALEFRPWTPPKFEIISQICDNCYKNDTKTCLFAGKFNTWETLYLRQNKASVFLINDFPITPVRGVSDDEMKVWIFIFKIKKTSDLLRLMHRVKQSKWWNVSGYFFIYTPHKNCHDFISFLTSMWRKNFLNTFYICHSAIFAVNPFRQLAPSPWFRIAYKPEKPTRGKYFFYKLNVVNRSINCSHILFDRQKDLSNYKDLKSLHVVGKIGSSSIDDEQPIFKYFSILADLMSLGLGTKFNSRYTEEFSYVSSNQTIIGTPLSMLLEDQMQYPQVDVLLQPMIPHNIHNIEFSSMITVTAITIVMHHTKPVSIFRRICEFFSVWMIAASFILVIITTGVIKWAMRLSVSTSLIHVLAVFLNGPLQRQPRLVSFRIFFINVLLFILIAQAVFRGRILTLIMKPVSDDVKTIEDFEKIAHNYKLYVLQSLGNYLSPALRQQMIESDAPSCEFIRNDPKAACVFFKHANNITAMNHSLYVIPERLSFTYLSYPMRKNWPLRDKFNKVCSRIYESALNAFVLRWARYNASKTFIVRNALVKQRRRLTFDDVFFAYQILLSGLALAFVCFLYEIRFWKLFRSLFIC